jgi:large subunit ribosomal protein L25
MAAEAVAFSFMAKQVKLSVQSRAGAGRPVVRKLRRQGLVPAVIYGAKYKPVNLQVPSRTLDTVLSHAVGENILVDLEIETDGKKASQLALIQQIQHEPVSGTVTHVDFHAVDMNETLHANIVIEPVGEANGVRNFGGLLEQMARTIEIECLPKDLPEVITVDVSALNIGDAIHVRDLPLPAGVTARSDADLTVFLVASPTVQEEVVAPVEGTPTEPEVIKEKKEEAAPAEGAKK